MKKCPKCNIDMILVQDDTPHPYSWGGFRLYGCQKCHRIYYQHLDSKGVESPEIKGDEEWIKRQQVEKREEKKKREKQIKEVKKILEKAKKRPWIKKPYYDPGHHHDSHLIN